MFSLFGTAKIRDFIFQKNRNQGFSEFLTGSGEAARGKLQAVGG
jgi:hypothetical protein